MPTRRRSWGGALGDGGEGKGGGKRWPTRGASPGTGELGGGGGFGGNAAGKVIVEEGSV